MLIFFSSALALIPQASSDSASTPVLLIVDIQNFYFAGGKLPLQGSDQASLVAKKILDFFRQKKWPIVHVRHLPQNMNDAPLSGDPQWSFQANVTPLPGEAVVTKHEINGFRGTNLLQILQDRKAKELVIIGMQTHMCLEGAVRAAVDYGFAVTIIEDACATRDLNFNGKSIPAEQVHLSTLATLKGTYAKVLTGNQFLAEQNAVTQAGK